MKDDRMSIPELAKDMGKDVYWVTGELRRDSAREIQQWPFATSKQGETGRWSYFISRTRYEKWKTGELASETVINYDLLADKIAERVLEKLRPGA